MNDVLTLARSRARHWSRVFDGLVDVLERLERQPDSLLARSLVFLIHRALTQSSDARRPVSAGRLLQKHAAGAGDGVDLFDACEWIGSEASASRAERGARDELEVLLALASSLTQDEAPGVFDDTSVGDEQLAREYHSLRQAQATSVQDVSLFPPSFRDCWQELIDRAEAESDPLRKLARELSLMRVIRALYALAIGYRDLGPLEEGMGEGVGEGREPWLAFSLGEATLGKCA